MNRNTYSYNNVPTVQIERSKFVRERGLTTTANVGKLIPLIVDSDVLPGQTTSASATMVIRMTTPVNPFMGNLYGDLYAFGYPQRLAWDEWVEMMGENKDGAWAQTIEKTVPQLKANNTTGFAKGSVFDYMGLPILVPNIEVSQLPFRMYVEIWNEWFRNQSYTAPQANPKDSTNIMQGTLARAGGDLLPVYKFKDRFTSVLPQAQKGDPVILNIGKEAPIKLLSGLVNGNGQFTTANADLAVPGKGQLTHRNLSYTGDPSFAINTNNKAGLNDYTGTISSSDAAPNGLIIDPNGTLYADLANAVALSMNALRYMGAEQRDLEKDARGGTRYTEILQNKFGVSNPDSRMQRPEYLGGKRIPIQVNQVAQTSASTAESELGRITGYSLTIDKDHIFTKSFTEHMMVMYLLAIRYDHSYSFGIEKQWTRKRKFDFYHPSFAHIGEVPLLNKEIFAQGNATDEQVFGIQEAWSEYKVKPNIVTAAMRPKYPTGLTSWTLTDDYSSLPVCSTEWLIEDIDIVDRVLAVSHTVEDQFKIDMALVEVVTMPMPLHSVPGWFDHF